MRMKVDKQKYIINYKEKLLVDLFYNTALLPTEKTKKIVFHKIMGIL